MSDTNRNYYRKLILLGPGGIRCACCRPFRTIKASRIYVNRRTRRILAAEVRKMTEDALSHFVL